MKLVIQHMVSQRCQQLVKTELEKAKIGYRKIELGEVEIDDSVTPESLQKFKEALHVSGLEIINDKNDVIVEKICNIIIEMIHHTEEKQNLKFSLILSHKMGYSYHRLSEIFTKCKGITIEHYIILNRMEKIKELILYNELSLTEIAYAMNYSSVAYLSKQFKQETGFTPSEFKQLKGHKRKNLEDL